MKTEEHAKERALPAVPQRAVVGRGGGGRRGRPRGGRTDPARAQGKAPAAPGNEPHGQSLTSPPVVTSG